MKKTIATLVASGLIALGGVAAVSAASDTSTPTPGAAITVTAEDGPRDTILSDVLKSLVTDGTISQAQADKIVAALDAKHTELRATRDAARVQMQSFLEDGVISADELAQLPADHPLRGVGSILDDGQITLDELRSLRGPGGVGHRGPGFGGENGFGGGLHFGAPFADEAPGASTDGSTS